MAWAMVRRAPSRSGIMIALSSANDMSSRSPSSYLRTGVLRVRQLGNRPSAQHPQTAEHPELQQHVSAATRGGSTPDLVPDSLARAGTPGQQRPRHYADKGPAICQERAQGIEMTQPWSMQAAGRGSSPETGTGIRIGPNVSYWSLTVCARCLAQRIPSPPPVPQSAVRLRRLLVRGSCVCHSFCLPCAAHSAHYCFTQDVNLKIAERPTTK